MEMIATVVADFVARRQIYEIERILVQNGATK